MCTSFNFVAFVSLPSCSRLRAYSCKNGESFRPDACEIRFRIEFYFSERNAVPSFARDDSSSTVDGIKIIRPNEY